MPRLGGSKRRWPPPKKIDIEEFKSFNDFQEVVELTASKYFG